MEFPPFGLHAGKPCIDAGIARGVRDDHLVARVVQLDTDSFADSTGSARDKRELLRHALYLIKELNGTRRTAMCRGSDYFNATRVACSTAPFVDFDTAVLTASALLPATWIAS